MSLTVATLIGSAGVFLGVVGREVVRLAADKFVQRDRNGNGNGKTALWREAIKPSIVESVATEIQKSVLPILTVQTEILRTLARHSEDIKSGITELVTLARHEA